VFGIACALALVRARMLARALARSHLLLPACEPARRVAYRGVRSVRSGRCGGGRSRPSAGSQS
jgi:ABC-type Fe3+ transport system permease subunit